MAMKPRTDLLRITQFDLLDCYKNNYCIPTPFGLQMIDRVQRLSPNEYSLWLRPPMIHDSVQYYLKLNRPGFLHVLCRFEPECEGR